MKRALQITVLLIGLLLVMAWFAGLFNRRIPADLIAPPAVTATEGLRVEAETVPLTETVAATVIAREATRVSTRILGNITHVAVRAGDRVERDSLLVRLDDREHRARLAQTEQQHKAIAAQLADAERELGRFSQLLAQGTVAQADVDRLRTRVASLQADLNRAEQSRREAEAALSYTQVRAPINGRVVERLVEPGDTVAPGQLMISLYDPASLQLAAQVREGLALRLTIGQPLTAWLDALQQAIEVRIEERVPGADPGARTVLIKAGLPVQETLLPGMYASLAIPAGSETLLLIPQAAVTRVGQITSVEVLGEHGPQRRLVALGREIGDRVVAVSGLAAGEHIRLP